MLAFVYGWSRSWHGAGMAGFKSYTEESLAVDVYGKSAEFTATPFLIIEASIDQYDGYQTMKRREGGYEANDEWVENGSILTPTYRLTPTSTPGWKLEVAPAVSGTAKMRFIEDPGAFASANDTTPTVLCQMAENGLAPYIAGIYWENQDSGMDDANRCYSKALEYLKGIPKGLRG